MTGMNDTATGTYRGCSSCRAPIVSPFPDDWILELIKEGPRHGPVTSFFTPHLPGCAQPPANPQPGHAIRVPGNYVAGVSSDPPPVPSTFELPGYLYYASTGTTDAWIPLGVAPPPDSTTVGWAVDDIADGQAVTMDLSGPGGTAWIKPVVQYSADGDVIE